MNGTEERVDRDVTAVLQALRRWGPASIDQLGIELSAMAWDHDRIQQAVVAAWAAGLLSFDVDDRLVAL